MLLGRRRRQVELQQGGQVILDAAVVGAQSQQDLAQFRPALLHSAVAEVGFRILVRRNVDGADDIAQFLARGGAHGPADGLNDIDRAFAGFQKGHGVKGGGIGPFAENADIDNAVGAGGRGGGGGQFLLGIVPGGHIAGSVQVFQGVGGGGLPAAIAVHPLLQPLADGGRGEIRGHILGFVHGVHKGDAGFDGDVAVLRMLGSPAHRQGKGQAAQVVVGGQGAAALALGVLGQLIGRRVSLPVVNAQGNDAVVGQPAVVDGLHIAFAVKLHAKGIRVIHTADNPIPGLIEIHLAGIVDPRRSGLIDAVSSRKGIAVVAEGKIAPALLFRGFGTAAQAGGAVGLVGNQHAGGRTGFDQGRSNAMAALVSAKDDAEGFLPRALLDPAADFRRFSSNLALDFGGADIAVVGGGILDGVDALLPFGVIAFVVPGGGFIGTDGQGAQVFGAVLEIFPADLGDEGNGGAKDDSQAAGRSKFLDNPQGDAGFAGPAGQDDFAAGLAGGIAVGIRGGGVFLQDADAGGHRLGLHCGFGLARRRFGIRIRWARELGFGRGGGLPLLQNIGVDVDQFDRPVLVGHIRHLAGVVAHAVVAVGHQPALGKEGVDRGGGEPVDLIFCDVVAVAGGVQLAGFALDRNGLPVRTAAGDDVDADVDLIRTGKPVFPFRPGGPTPSLGNIPFLEVGRDGDGQLLQPGAARALGIHFSQGIQGLVQDVRGRGVLHTSHSRIGDFGYGAAAGRNSIRPDWPRPGRFAPGFWLGKGIRRRIIA